MTITFCGHREVHDEARVRLWLRAVVEELAASGAEVFYLGGYGAFDAMAAGVVRELKKEYPRIQSILVLPYLDRKVDASGYDGTTYPPLETVPKRYAISHRNRWMAEQADVVVTYVRHGWGGAAAMAAWAEKKGKQIISWKED